MVDKPKLDQMLSNLKEYVDSFTVLGEQAVLDPPFAERLGEMARFRNRLVHLYWDIENRRVFSYLQDSLGDLEGFGQAVAGHPW